MKIPKSLLSKANQAFLRRDFSQAEMLYRRILKYDSAHLTARGNLATTLNELGKLEEFYLLAQELYKEHPQDAGVLNKMGIAYYRKGEFTEAYSTLKLAINFDPKRYETFLNLSSIAGEVGDIRGGLEYALEAVSLEPSNSGAHTNLGSAFMAAGQPDEAKHCFETVLLLDPTNHYAGTNLAVLETRGGNHTAAIVAYERCLTDPTLNAVEAQKIRFFLGISYLTIGNLPEGWKNYSYGFIEESTHGRNPCRRFRCREWKGEPLAGKTILVWREQGLGDELMFYSVLEDLRHKVNKEGGDVIVESDWRLCQILSRTFPTFKVRPQAYLDKPSLQSPFNDFDFQIPQGSLFAYFRQSQADFNSSNVFLKVDNDARQLFDQRLGDRSGKLRVGICWRSGALSALRNINYTALVDWEQILKIKDLQLVNLQYGDTESERKKAIDELGLLINHWPDLDLKDDIDNTAALCSNLDLVVSVGTASAQLACAVGTPTLILATGFGWTSFGTTNYPVYPNARFITTNEPNRAVATLLPRVARALEELFLEPEPPKNLLDYLSVKVERCAQDSD